MQMEMMLWYHVAIYRSKNVFNTFSDGKSLGDGRYLAFTTHRAKVVGGWLVHSVVGDGSEQVSEIAGSR